VGNRHWKRLTRLEQTDPVYGAAFSPDGQLVALAVAGSEDKSLRIYRRDNGQLVRTIDLGTAVPLDVVWHAQGNRLYAPCSDKIVRIYDAQTAVTSAAWRDTPTGCTVWH